MDVNRYKWKNRLLFLFAPAREHPLFDHLINEVESNKEAVADRDLVVFEIIDAGPSRVANERLDPKSPQLLRDRFDVPRKAFAVVLVGKDGGVKLNRQAETRLQEIFGLIDAMPMRQMEMKQRIE